LAFLTLRIVENPIRFSSRIHGKGVVLLAAACVVVVCGTSLILIQGARNAWGNPGIQGMMSQVSATHLWLSEDCNSAVPLGQREASCTWNPDAAGSPIYLVGDSMAGALSEAALGAGEALGRPVMAGTKGACPFVGLDLNIDGRPDGDCNTFVEDSLGWLVTQPPSDVVLSSALGYLVIDGVSFGSPDTDHEAVGREAKTAAYLQGLGQTVARLSAAGHRVNLVLPPPGFPTTVMAYDAWYPSQCATYEALSDIASCGVSRAESEVVGETAALFADVKTVVEANGGHVLDLRSDLCRNDLCATNFDNDWLYLDGSHLSVSMSQRLSPALISAIATS
jgi:hypothetical protein